MIASLTIHFSSAVEFSNLWSVEGGEPLEAFSVEARGAYSLAFSPDGHWLGPAAADKKLRVWELDPR